MDEVRSFGEVVPGARYVLRPGGYVVVRGAEGRVAVVATRGGLYLPGGGQEPGEEPAAAAVREAHEECGLRVRPVERLGTADEFLFAREEATHFQKRCAFFRAELLGAEGAGEPDHELCWMRPEEARVRLRSPSQRWALERFLDLDLDLDLENQEVFFLRSNRVSNPSSEILFTQ